jgi:error-prone DNA polymerase
LAARSTSAGAGGAERQLALPLEPTSEIPTLSEQTPWERMLADYRLTSLSVGVHPLDLLRPHLPSEVLTSLDLEQLENKSPVAVAGLVIARQRPSTANGVVFMLFEDEHGQMNLVVPPPVYERYRALVRGEPLLLARGRFERYEHASASKVTNVVVEEFTSLGPLARKAANEAEVVSAMPGAHHFGGR